MHFDLHVAFDCQLVANPFYICCGARTQCPARLPLQPDAHKLSTMAAVSGEAFVQQTNDRLQQLEAFMSNIIMPDEAVTL